MKRIYLMSMTMLFTLGATAQVTLNASLAPAHGTQFIFYDANVPSPAFTFSKSGTSNTWDFTTISPLPTEYDTVFILDPATVAGATAAFPSATHVTREHDSQNYTVVEVDNSDISLLGMMGDVFGTGFNLVAPLTPPLAFMTFPYTFGNGFNSGGVIEIKESGNFIGQPTIDSVWLKSTILADRFVIAGGNMIIPSGTFPSILERAITTQIDSAWIKSILTGNMWVPAPGFPTTVTDSAFYWYTGQSLQPYAHALYDDTGLHDVVFFKNSVVGLNEAQVPDALSVYPNPVQNELHFTLAGMESTGYDIAVFDLHGREVIKAHGNMTSVNVSGLAHGLYHLRIADDLGHIASKRFIKE